MHPLIYKVGLSLEWQRQLLLSFIPVLKGKEKSKNEKERKISHVLRKTQLQYLTSNGNKGDARYYLFFFKLKIVRWKERNIINNSTSIPKGFRIKL